MSNIARDEKALRQQIVSAAYSGQTQICLDMISKGVPMDASDVLGATPLLSAASGGHLDTCLALLDAGADGAAEDKCQNTAAMRAAQSSSPGAIKTALGLLVDPRIPARNSQGIDQLNAATLGGTMEMMSALLDAGMNINEPASHSGFTPLHRALMTGRVDKVDLLINRGADVGSVSADGRRPVHLTQDGKSLVKLVKAGVLIEALGTRKLRLINTASSSGNEDLTRALLALGSSPDHCTFKTEKISACFAKSPFVNAIDSGDVDIMVLHLERFGPPGAEELRLEKRSLAKHTDIKATIDVFMARCAIDEVTRPSVPGMRGPQ